METFSFFWPQFRRAYDSAYDSDFDFHNVISVLTIPTPIPSLVKTSLYVFRNSSGLLKFCFLTRQNLVLVTILHYK